MLTRLPSVSKNETYRPTLGISMGSPSTSPPASVTRRMAASTSSTERTTDGYCAGQSGFLWKKPPLIAPGLIGPLSFLSVVVGKDIVAHLLPQHLRLPAKCVLIELRHALAIVVGNFEVYDRVRFAHDGPLSDCPGRCN